MMSPRRLLLGVGNPDRGDDAAGRIVAQRLVHALPGDVAVVEHDGDATGLLALFDGVSNAVIVDACRSGAAAGTVHRFDVIASPLPQARFGLSTHGFGLDAAIELARALGRLPPFCIVYAIEGANFDTGAGLSTQATAAVDRVAAQIAAEFARTPA